VVMDVTSRASYGTNRQGASAGQARRREREARPERVVRRGEKREPTRDGGARLRATVFGPLGETEAVPDWMRGVPFN
jgi:hypothetical protein